MKPYRSFLLGSNCMSFFVSVFLFTMVSTQTFGSENGKQNAYDSTHEIKSQPDPEQDPMDSETGTPVSFASDKPSTFVVIINDIGFFVPSVLLFATVHELGHVSFARIFGDSDAHFHYYVAGEGIGISHYDRSKLSPLGHAATEMGGIVFSRVLAEVSDLTLKHTDMPRWIQPFFSITYLFSRFDFIQYVVRDILLPGDFGDDIEGFVSVLTGDKKYENYGHRSVEKTGLLLVLLGVGIFDLVLDWDKVQRHWNVVCGGRYKDPLSISTQAANPVDLGFHFDGRNGYATFSLSF